MKTRHTVRTVSFQRPFSLSVREDAFPPGLYRVEVDEELIDGMSFLAYRRVQTSLQCLTPQSGPRPAEVHIVNADELRAALAADPPHPFANAPAPETPDAAAIERAENEGMAVGRGAGTRAW